MTQNKQMHALVIGHCNRWINLFLQTRVLVNLESVCHSVGTLVSDEALFEDKWGVPLHILNPSVLLSLLINNNIEFFDWLLVLPVQFDVHFNDFSSLASNYIVQLSSKVFRWEAEILGQYDVSENVLTISSLNLILVLSRQVLVDSSWLEVQQFVDVVVELEKLAGHYIDLHYNSICNLIGFVQIILFGYLVLEWCQALRSILIHNTNTSQFTCCIGHLLMSSLVRVLNFDFLFLNLRTFSQTSLINMPFTNICK